MLLSLLGAKLGRRQRFDARAALEEQLAVVAIRQLEAIASRRFEHPR
jgi:hypothetical protein